MDHLPLNDENNYSASRRPDDHPLDEKGVVSEVAIPIQEGDSDVFTDTQPYRLYKRRWIGVFAIVSTPFPAT